MWLILVQLHGLKDSLRSPVMRNIVSDSPTCDFSTPLYSLHSMWPPYSLQAMPAPDRAAPRGVHAGHFYRYGTPGRDDFGSSSHTGQAVTFLDLWSSRQLFPSGPSSSPSASIGVRPVLPSNVPSCLLLLYPPPAPPTPTPTTGLWCMSNLSVLAAWRIQLIYQKTEFPDLVIK